MLKGDIIWPRSRRFITKTTWEPVGFFSECLCNSTNFDLMLGFFSSSAISVLSDGFAAFLHNGGKMRLIINDILTESDKEAIEKGKGQSMIEAFDLDNIEALRDTLSDRDRHFFNCLSWLIRNERIEIKIIAPKSGIGIAHTKCGVFSDGINKVAFEGSVNFSKTALIDNKESLTASCSWDGEVDNEKIKDTQEQFNKTFLGNDEDVIYLDAKDIKTRICSKFEAKEITELLDDEYNILENASKQDVPVSVKMALAKAKERVKKAIEKHKPIDVSPELSLGPKFPYSSGPREYQQLAFDNWKNNRQKGLFAMATGTGKTITSLNCLLEIYKRTGSYKAIILVPTIALVDQWEEECKKFNFEHIIKVCTKNSSWRSDVDRLKMTEAIGSDPNLSYIIICTYASYGKDTIFSDLNEFPKKQVLFIADECHNIGAPGILKKISGIPYLRRIGLSATPDRQFDDYGNKKIREFFGAEEKYTYEYSMEEAIKNGVLCKYKYFPHIVRLTDEEMFEYSKISIRLAKLFNFAKGDFTNKGDDLLTALLLKRKRIIHKAENKVDVFTQIINERIKKNGNLKYTLVYVPEGNFPDTYDADIFEKKDIILDDPDSEHLIDVYTQIIRAAGEKVTVKEFTSQSAERESTLKSFANGDLDVLTSMKCLDEGVDVPRSELAIFCSSTGNPRQFIQRRGRILRTHPDKHEAIIHDLIVIPEVNVASDSFEMERKLVETELKRVRNFALLSENVDDTIREMDYTLDYYNLSLF